ncbi:CopG family ribbon-helix-helix protein [Pelagibacterium sediminicola]|uniref:CopG family ribbon-helix-helix protein n=1 Tax=Pelagibacterium sediminicola TaxID=2248761 RepID=UPI000E30F45D|nr:ribbon-helix-helix domain-containing protein [Pelagibacterium sediminicola]
MKISIRPPIDVIEKFDRIAAALDRDRTWVMIQAFQFYLDREGVGILTDAEGVAAVDRDETVEWGTAVDRIDTAIDRGTVAYNKKAS